MTTNVDYKFTSRYTRGYDMLRVTVTEAGAAGVEIIDGVERAITFESYPDMRDYADKNGYKHAPYGACTPIFNARETN